MSGEEQTRGEVEELVKEDEPVQEAVIETVIEEEVKPVKAKSKAKAKAKPKVKITKEPFDKLKKNQNQ